MAGLALIGAASMAANPIGLLTNIFDPHVLARAMGWRWGLFLAVRRVEILHRQPHLSERRMVSDEL